LTLSAAKAAPAPNAIAAVESAAKYHDDFFISFLPKIGRRTKAARD
jgi:hypothetical protein